MYNHMFLDFQLLYHCDILLVTKARNKQQAEVGNAVSILFILHYTNARLPNTNISTITSTLQQVYIQRQHQLLLRDISDVPRPNPYI